MAFGGLKGTLTGSGASIVNPAIAAGSVVVAVGDLVFCAIAEQTTLSATATCTDDLGNTYTETNIGTDAGTATGHAYYARVTVAGTLTKVNVTTVAGGDDYAVVAAVFEGPFAAPPIDKNPGNLSNDIVSPLTCPATTVLSQADELVVAWVAASSAGNSWTATSPNLMAQQAFPSANAHIAIGYQVVSATTSIAPAFDSGGDEPNFSVLGTTTFKKAAAADTTTVDQATITLTGAAINEIYPQITAATISVAGQAINEIYPNVAAATITLTGQAIADRDVILVSQATITLTGQTVNEVSPQITAASIVLTAQNIAANDTELVSGAAITLTGQTVNEVYPDVSPAQITLSGQDITPTDTSGADATTVDAAAITLTGAAILVNDSELVGSAALSLAGQAIAANDSELVGPASVSLTGGAVGDLDTVLVAKSDITLTGGTITLPADSAADTTIVSPATITLSSGGVSYELREDGGYELREDGGRELREPGSDAVAVNDTELVSQATITLTGGDITLVDTSTDVAGGTHHRWPLYVNWHLKDKCWRRVEDCPPEIAEEIDRELPYEAPLAPEEIRRLVGTLSALVPEFSEDDTETVALLIAMED